MHVRPTPRVTTARDAGRVTHGTRVVHRDRRDGVRRAAALLRLGATRLWDGDVAGATAAVDEAHRVAASEGHEGTAAAARGYRGLLCALGGALTKAHGQATSAPDRLEARLAIAIVGWHRGEPVDLGWSDHDAATMLAVLRARWRQADGDVVGARGILTEAQNLRDGRALPRIWLAVALADQSIMERRPRGALDLLAEARDAPPDLAPLLRLAAARAQLAGDEPARARATLAPLRSGAGHDVTVEAWLLDALAADQLGLEGAVCIALAQALDTAAPEGIRRPFLYPGLSTRDLLDRHRDLVRVHRPLADGLLSGVDERREPALAEPITERETVVLRYLPTLLTAREIASELYVSPNTIKTQVKSIYRKLSVGTRRAAVDRARRLGLL